MYIFRLRKRFLLKNGCILKWALVLCWIDDLWGDFNLFQRNKPWTRKYDMIHLKNQSMPLFSHYSFDLAFFCISDLRIGLSVNLFVWLRQHVRNMKFSACVCLEYFALRWLCENFQNSGWLSNILYISSNGMLQSNRINWECPSKCVESYKWIHFSNHEKTKESQHTQNEFVLFGWVCANERGALVKLWLICKSLSTFTKKKSPIIKKHIVKRWNQFWVFIVFRFVFYFITTRPHFDPIVLPTIAAECFIGYSPI